MPKKTNLTDAEFAALIAEADDFANALDMAAERWPFGMGPPPPNLEDAAQTVNRVAENALRLQRAILGRIALAREPT